MSLLLTPWHIFTLVMTFVWPICFIADLVLRTFDPYKRRMNRGKFTRWEIRTFGSGWRHLWDMPILTGLIVLTFTQHVMWPVHLWWAYIGVTCAIDWITGSDDPPYRRWLAEAVKKLKISAPPRPVIDLS